MKTHIKISSKLSESEQESCTSIFRNVMRLRQKMNATASEVARSYELHTSEMSLIDTLGKYGPLTMGELAAFSFSSPANARAGWHRWEPLLAANIKRAVIIY